VAVPEAAAGQALSDRIAAALRDVPDFPHEGIVFKDIAGVLADPGVFADVVRGLGADLPPGSVDLVAGVEARGFLFAGALALQLDCGLVPVRKAGKLPPPTLHRSYALEYGTADIEVSVGLLDGRRVLLVDDVLATGGTLRAAAELVAESGGTVVEYAVVVELAALGGRAALEDVAPLRSLLRI
jgi:adenine phosphoribosyltransferase